MSFGRCHTRFTFSDGSDIASAIEVSGDEVLHVTHASPVWMDLQDVCVAPWSGPRVTNSERRLRERLPRPSTP